MALESSNFLDKSDGIKDVPLQQETPEQLRQKKLNEINTRSQDYYNKAKPVDNSLGNAYSREASQLMQVGKYTVDESRYEAVKSNNYKALNPEVKGEIKKIYDTLSEDFETELLNIQADYAGKPNNGNFQQALFNAQKKFEDNLIIATKEVHGKTNGPGGAKDAKDAEKAKDAKAIEDGERDRFFRLMGDMLDKEVMYKSAADKRERERASVAERFVAGVELWTKLDPYWTKLDSSSTNQVA